MSLAGKTIIVTGGPTREWLDPVRYLSNASSGRMGIALADEGSRRSARTVFIHGPIDERLVAGKGYAAVAVESTEEMLGAVLSRIGDDTILVMAAAPADYAPAERSAVKIKKGEGDLVLRLRKNPDILRTVAAARRDRGLVRLFLAGFAAETNNVEEYARTKLVEKDLDIICCNDVTREGAGFGTSTNIITIFDRDGSREDLPLLSKEEVAVRIFDYIERKMK